MKKRLISFVLVFVMAVGLCIPASASAYAESTNTLTLTSVDDVKDVSIENIDISMEAAAENEDSATPQDGQRLSSTDIRNMSTIRQVVIYPIAYCIEEEAAYIIEDIYRSAAWPTVKNSDASLKLSPDAVTAFVEETLTALANSSNTSAYTWVIAGWRVVSIHELTAERPRRLEWTPSNTCLDGTAKQTLTINQQSVRVTIGHNYSIPSDPYSYYYLGISGAFYFIYTSGSNTGQEGSTLMGGGVRMNSTN